MASLYRPLLFSTVDSEAARARGVPVRLVSAMFFVVVAVAAALGSMAVGILLATFPLIAPAAAAVRLTRRPGRALALSICLGLGITWGGILISFLWPWRHPPVRFTVSALAAVTYFVAAAVSWNLYARKGGTIVGDGAETGQRWPLRNWRWR